MSEMSTAALAPEFGRPHVVLLGAGTSRAALPNGDRRGRELPLLNDLVAVLRLEPILRRSGVSLEDENFEALYSRLTGEPQYAQLVCELEEAVFAYFADLQLPDEPTLYDHLVLSLREKDLIATFNWDPLLWQALCRNGRYAPMPLAVYLHGNVAVGYCNEHTPISVGTRGKTCQQCGRPYKASRLLYPVTQKNYTADPFIGLAWAQVKRGLADAFVFTIFGYSAPATDVEAVSLLRAGWGSSGQRHLEEIELVNVIPEDELLKSWRPFIHSHHYGYATSFYDTMLAQAPRRSCEAYWAQNMECVFLTPNRLPCDADWAALRAWFKPLVAQERASRS